MSDAPTLSDEDRERLSEIRADLETGNVSAYHQGDVAFLLHALSTARTAALDEAIEVARACAEELCDAYNRSHDPTSSAKSDGAEEVERRLRALRG